MTDRALTEADRNMLRLLAIAHARDELSGFLVRLLAEHAALLAVARAAERLRADLSERAEFWKGTGEDHETQRIVACGNGAWIGITDALAALPPGILDKENGDG